MKKYNISKPEKYIKDGAEKTFWANVGTMTEFEKQDGTISRIIEIPAIGLKASIFEQKPQENVVKKETPKSPIPVVEYDEVKKDVTNEEVNVEDIPF